MSRDFLRWFVALTLAASVGVGAGFAVTSLEEELSLTPSPSDVYYGAAPTAKQRFDSQAVYRREAVLVFVGDIMLDRDIRRRVEDKANDYRRLFSRLEWPTAPDILFGNLEGPISDRGADLGGLYSFRADPAALFALREAGFNVLSVANNHSADWGREAFEDTLRRLAEAGIAPVGGGLNFAEVRRPLIIRVGETNVGFLAFSDVGPEWFSAGEDKSGILLASDSHLTEIVAAAAAAVDVLAVSFHFGEEYQTEPTGRQRQLVQTAVEQGAKIVVGHHSHVVQPLWRVNGAAVAYGLGNFIFDQSFSPETMRGAALLVKLRDAKISEAVLLDVFLNDSFQPSFTPPEN